MSEDIAPGKAPTTLTGFCMWPSAGSHTYCGEQGFACACPCHTDPAFLAAEEATYAELAKSIHPESADNDEASSPD